MDVGGISTSLNLSLLFSPFSQNNISLLQIQWQCCSHTSGQTYKNVRLGMTPNKNLFLETYKLKSIIRKKNS